MKLSHVVIAIAATICSMAANAGNENGHEWVDLGLPSGTKWATCNIGAETPGEAGIYYAWDGSNIAGNMWGGRWRLPTPDDIKELVKNCEFVWSKERRGMVVRSKTNSNEIFMPAAGYQSETGSLYGNNAGHYLSSEGSKEMGGYEAGLTFNAGTTYLDRYMGLNLLYTVRPVCNLGSTEATFRGEARSSAEEEGDSYWTRRSNYISDNYNSSGNTTSGESYSNPNQYTYIDKENLPKKTVEGYRVQIFSSNQKTAKAEAYKAAQSAKSAFPELSVYTSFKTPFWKVRVGDFESNAEAQSLKNELKSALPEYAGEIYIVKTKVKVPIYPVE